jgi:hypothetical protein
MLSAAGDIPFCFSLATCAALVAVMFARLRGESIDATAKLPFGASCAQPCDWPSMLVNCHADR